MRRMLSTLAGALLLLPTSALAQHEHGDMKAEITAASEAFEAAYNAGDGAAVAAIYTADAIVKAPNMAPITKPEELLAFWSEAASGEQKFDLTTQEVYGMGDYAYEIGMYSSEDSAGAHTDHGHYFALWRKVDGKWKLHRDAWSSDMNP